MLNSVIHDSHRIVVVPGLGAIAVVVLERIIFNNSNFIKIYP
jgi:hypothetical protein